MLFFGTLFNVYYLSRGITLLTSMRAQLSDFKLFVLCLDQYTFNYFAKAQSIYPEVIPISISEIERNTKLLLEAKRILLYIKPNSTKIYTVELS